MNLKGKNFLKLLDYTPEEIEYLVDLAAELKDEQVGEFYDRFMAGSIDKAIIGYLDRNFEFFAKISRELYSRVEEFFDLWLKHQYKTRGKKDVDEDDELVLPRKQMKETQKRSLR